MKEKLTKLWNELKNTKIPSFIGLDEYDDWVEDLIEIDAVIAGLLFGAASGNKVEMSEIPDIENLKINFQKLELKMRHTYEEIGEAKEYLKLIVSICKELKGKNRI